MKYVWIALMMSGYAAAQECPFPTCVQWYKDGQCAQVTCEPCPHFQCLQWYSDSRCFTGTCDAACTQITCMTFHQNGACMTAVCNTPNAAPIP